MDRYARYVCRVNAVGMRAGKLTSRAPEGGVASGGPPERKGGSKCFDLSLR